MANNQDDGQSHNNDHRMVKSRRYLQFEPQRNVRRNIQITEKMRVDWKIIAMSRHDIKQI